MTAYVVAHVNVTDKERYAEYVKQTPAVVASFGGRFIVRGGETVTIEGPEVDERVVVLEFANMDQAVACFRSPAYEEAKKFRLGAAEMRLFAVQGFDPAEV
jgi:uncharacterized protein (DUF1330 family)